MSNFTKGPWVWSDDRFRGGYSCLYSESADEPVLWPQRENDGDEGAAWFATDDYYGETALVDADAHLIAAAPDLYEAIEEALSCVTDMGIKQQMINALAKARGET